MKKKLYQYAVIYHERSTGSAETATKWDSKIVIEPKTMLAASEKEVLFRVTREIPEDCVKNPDDVEIIIGNF